MIRWEHIDMMSIEIYILYYIYVYVNILFIIIIFLYYLYLLGLPAFADFCVLGCDVMWWSFGEQNFSETGFKVGAVGASNEKWGRIIGEF